MFVCSSNVYKWDYTEYYILCLISFTKFKFSKVHPWVYYAVHIFCCWVVFHCMNMPYLVYQLCSLKWTFLCKHFGRHMFSFLWGKYIGVEFLANRMVFFDFVRNCWTIFKLLQNFILPTEWRRNSSFSTLSKAFDVARLCNFSHSSRYEK